jgi:hypothetical protein
VTIAQGQENNPLLKGVEAKFNSPSWLYQNTPLRTSKATVLLYGHNPGKAPEPVFWLNEAGKGKVAYTSLGHWNDWKIESFQNLVFNTVDFLLNESEKPTAAAVEKTDDVNLKGDSYASAIIINEKTTTKGVAAERDWLTKNLPGHRVLLQSLRSKDDKHYDVIQVHLDGAEKREVYFDIGSFFGNFDDL